VTGIFIGIAVLAAVIAVGIRRVQRVRFERRKPGATIHLPVAVSSFDEIDAALQGRTCWCGGALLLAGETSRVVGQRRYRIARLVCAQCERDEHVYFDVTTVFH
jgi:hypothetical protein